MTPTHLALGSSAKTALCGSKEYPITGVQWALAHVDGWGSDICPECQTLAGDLLPPPDQIERRREAGRARLAARHADEDRKTRRHAAARREAAALYRRLLADSEWCAAVDTEWRLFGDES